MKGQQYPHSSNTFQQWAKQVRIQLVIEILQRVETCEKGIKRLRDQPYFPKQNRVAFGTPRLSLVLLYQQRIHWREDFKGLSIHKDFAPVDPRRNFFFTHVLIGYPFCDAPRDTLIALTISKYKDHTNKFYVYYRLKDANPTLTDRVVKYFHRYTTVQKF